MRLSGISCLRGTREAPTMINPGAMRRRSLYAQRIPLRVPCSPGRRRPRRGELADVPTKRRGRATRGGKPPSRPAGVQRLDAG